MTTKQTIPPPPSARASFAAMPTGLVQLSPAYVDALRGVAPPARRRKPVRLGLVILMTILAVVIATPSGRARVVAKVHPALRATGWRVSSLVALAAPASRDLEARHRLVAPRRHLVLRIPLDVRAVSAVREYGRLLGRPAR
jgi:hypothetical protein